MPELVSAVIATYNGAGYVAAAVASVLGQTYENIELIVVDDGSTDDTWAVLQTFTDDRLRIIQQPNSGVAAAYNRGVEAASGPIVAFLDHDDEWLPHKLDLQVPRLMSSGAGVLGTMTQYFGSDGQLIRAYIGEATEARQQDIAAARFMPFPRATTIMRTELYRELGGFDVAVDRTIGPVEDLDFFSRVAQNGRTVELLPEVLGRTRVHPRATSANRFFVMQDATRFLVARAEARAAGGDLMWDDFRRQNRTSVRCRVQDRGHFYYRNAGMYFASGDHLNAARYLAGAVALTPSYAARRLRRQRSSHP